MFFISFSFLFQLMSKVASITIRLEIQTGAPFIKFESAGFNGIISLSEMHIIKHYMEL